MYRAVTRNIAVSVSPEYRAERSDPATAQYFWAYTVEITNQGLETVKLLRRHWIITDGSGQTQEVHGDGVVGEQPVLQPGDSFTYTSGCPLETSHGFMAGHYEMRSDTGELFLIEIPAFSLHLPDQRRTMH
jgi:ApaG protein